MKNKILVIIISIIIGILCGIVLQEYLLENNFDFNKNELYDNYSHIVSSYTNLSENIDEVKKSSIIYTFDSDDICISKRLKYEFSDEILAKEEYDRLLNQNNIYNLSIEMNIIKYNVLNFEKENKESILYNCKSTEKSIQDTNQQGVTNTAFEYILY